MSAANCGNCVYWFEDLSADASKSNEEGCGVGRPFVGTCQYLPPSIVPLPGNGNFICTFPLTHGTRWCGRWVDTVPDDDEPDGPDDGERVVVEMRRAA